MVRKGYINFVLMYVRGRKRRGSYINDQDHRFLKSISNFGYPKFVRIAYVLYKNFNRFYYTDYYINILLLKFSIDKLEGHPQKSCLPTNLLALLSMFSSFIDLLLIIHI